MEFDQRLQRALQRGENTRQHRGRELTEERLSREELRNLHSQARLELTDRVEDCLRKLADHIPGFEFQSLYREEGWGAKIHRDDLRLAPGGVSTNVYSRLEMLISPLGTAPIVELVVKGTIRNREVLQRRHFQQLSQIDLESFKELVDLWVLEFAEQFAAE